MPCRSIQVRPGWDRGDARSRRSHVSLLGYLDGWLHSIVIQSEKGVERHGRDTQVVLILDLEGTEIKDGEAQSITLPGCDWAAITEWQARKRSQSLATSGDVAEEVDQLQYELGDGPCLAAAADSELGAGC